MQKQYKILVICMLASLLTVKIAAQSDSVAANLVRHTTDFRFREGFYLNFEQVKNNRPIPKSRVLTSIDHRSNTFFEQITELRAFTYFDDLGNSRDVETRNLWGYSKNGILYIQIQGKFNRITIVGNICHFVANVTTFTSRHYDPYAFSPYGYSPYGFGYSPYGYGPSSQRATTELRQFLLDFSTGNVMDYDVRNVNLLLMTDPELHDEFASLRSRRKQQLRFMYIRRFNERNPLYLPR